MHIMDGILAAPVLAAGSALGLAGLAVGLRRLEPEQLPRTALLSAAFFVASTIHVPIGPASVHLVLSGLVGLMLGWAAFPAIAVGLLMQLLLFGFGGVSVLAVNLLCLALPAVAVFHLCGRPLRRGPVAHAFAWGAVAGALAVALGTALVAGFLALSGESFAAAARLVVFAHLPVMALEAVLVGTAAAFLRKVKPDALALPGRPLEDLQHA